MLADPWPPSLPEALCFITLPAFCEQIDPLGPAAKPSHPKGLYTVLSEQDLQSSGEFQRVCHLCAAMASPVCPPTACLERGAAISFAQGPDGPKGGQKANHSP